MYCALQRGWMWQLPFQSIHQNLQANVTNQPTDPPHTVSDVQVQAAQNHVSNSGHINKQLISGTKILVRLGINISRSALFMTTFCLSWLTLHELIQRTKMAKRWSFTQRNRLVSVLLPFSIAWEQPHKRVDINYFVAPKCLEMFWLMLKNRGLVVEFKAIEVSKTQL